MAKTQYVKSLAHKAMAGTAVHTYHKTCVQSYVTHTIGHKFTVSQMRIETLLIACREICLLLLVDSCSSQRSDSTRYKWNRTDICGVLRWNLARLDEGKWKCSKQTSSQCLHTGPLSFTPLEPLDHCEQTFTLHPPLLECVWGGKLGVYNMCIQHMWRGAQVSTTCF